MLTNPVVISIAVLLILSLLRINVVVALVISALTAGLIGDLGLTKTIETFTDGRTSGVLTAGEQAQSVTHGAPRSRVARPLIKQPHLHSRRKRNRGRA